MKKLICLLLLITAIPLTGCRTNAPKIEDIYDRVVELVEASYELNVVFYGEGLPCYDRTLPVYEQMYSDYTISAYTQNYDIVSDHAKFRSVEQIKAAAEQVYTPELLEKVVYPSAFTGLVITGAGSSGTQYANARYLEDETHLYMLSSANPAAATPLVYNYADMKIVQPSNSTRVIISLTAWEQDSPDSPFPARLTLSLVDGVWLLDKLTV